ncbi:MAG: DeoR/GlpR transcriptional regulator [Ruminococcaceae bacterium]|nr:DeoR/GlpR transcriptional regulator [Oscillospiraceae bacterium]
MLSKEREQEIMNILKSTGGFVTVRQLCSALFASESSIRRDLKSLEEKGLIKRSYGGASLRNSLSNIVTFNHRTRQNVNQKLDIAKKAAALIKDGDIVFLDQSSTAFYLATELMNKSSLTVVTNNIEILMLLSGSSVSVVSSGGFLSSENRNCLIGGNAQRTFENVFADIMFFSVKALTDDGIISDCSSEEISVRNSMLKNARKKVLLCDSSKFGECASFKQGELSDVDCFISEGAEAKRFARFDNKIELL